MIDGRSKYSGSEKRDCWVGRDRTRGLLDWENYEVNYVTRITISVYEDVEYRLVYQETSRIKQNGIMYVQESNAIRA